MILHELVKYYDAHASEDGIARLGYTDEPVAFALRIDGQGELVGVKPLASTVTVKDRKGKEKEVRVPKRLQVPEHRTRTSNAASMPFFLCDKPSFIVGLRDSDKEADQRHWEGMFEASRRLHHELLDGFDDDAAKAVLAFFDRWDIAEAGRHPLLQECAAAAAKGASCNLIFELPDGQWAQDHPMLRGIWEARWAESADTLPPGTSLVTGQDAPIARLHSAFKGVPKAQASGAVLVSFNIEATESHGHRQGANAPTGTVDAFKYAAALNALLASKSHHKNFDGLTVLYWADEEDEKASNVFGMALSGMSPFMAGEDAAPDIDQEALDALFGRLPTGYGIDVSALDAKFSNRFHVLGIAPNGGRLAVRFFLEDSFGEILRGLRRYYEDLAIVAPPKCRTEQLGIWSLLKESVNRNKKNPDIPSSMCAAFTDAMLKGFPFQDGLYHNVLSRLRVDMAANPADGNKKWDAVRSMWRKAAFIKAYLLRARCQKNIKEVLTMSLNEASNNTPYVLGRLFAVLERTQESALPEVKATIRVRYFTGASTMPSAVFPLLLQLFQCHTRKLSDNGRIYFEKLAGDLTGKLGDAFPLRLNTQEQGAFYLGYYHQRQVFFESKKNKDVADDATGRADISP